MTGIFRTTVMMAAALFLYCAPSFAQEPQKPDKLISLQAGDAQATAMEIEFKEDAFKLDSVGYFLWDNGRANKANPQSCPAHVMEFVFRDEPLSLRDALNAIEDGNYAQAIQTLGNLEEALNAGISVRARAFWLKQYLIYYSGHAKMMARNSEEAIKDMERYLKEYPDGYFAALARIGIGRSQLDMARRSDDKNKFQSARASFTAVTNLAKVPDLYVLQAKYWQAMADRYEGKTVAAATFKDIQKLLEQSRYSKLDPYVRLNKLCEAQRGRAMQTSDPEGGIKTLTDLLKNSGYDEVTAMAYVGIGDCYRSQKKMKEAALYYLRAALLFPNQREWAAAGLYCAADCFKKSTVPNGAAHSSLLTGELRKNYPDYEPFAKKLFKY